MLEFKKKYKNSDGEGFSRKTLKHAFHGGTIRTLEILFEFRISISLVAGHQLFQ